MTTLLPEAPVSQTSDERYEAEAFDGVIQVLGKTGDTRIMWDRRNKAEVSVAEAAFEAAKKAGALIYAAVGKEGERGEQVRTFDKKAERLIVVPAMKGG